MPNINQIRRIILNSSAAASAGGGPPPGVTGIIGRWDASVFSSLSLTGSSINSIADQSGAGNDLTWPGGAATKNLYNATGFNTSFPTIDFSNTNSGGLQKTGFALGTGNTLTVWFVGNANALFSQNNCRAMSYSGGTGGQADDDNNASFFVGQVGTTAVVQLESQRQSGIQNFCLHNTPHRFIGNN